jgi:hypothetical protein
MPHMISLLRYADLKARKIIRNRPQLKRLQDLHGFPRGRMFSPNTRTWTEEEIAAWYATRPAVEPGQWRGAARIKHEKKLLTV